MASEKKKNTAQVAAELARELLGEMGLQLWDVRFEKEGSQWYLRYYIDKEGGITIDDCEQFSRAVEKKLDAEDPIEQSYVLEVSSPGIERELTRDWHFDTAVGKLVSVRLIRPVEGIRDFTGALVGYSGGTITILLEDALEMSFEKSEAAYIRLYNDYSTEE